MRHGYYCSNFKQFSTAVISSNFSINNLCKITFSLITELRGKFAEILHKIVLQRLSVRQHGGASQWANLDIGSLVYYYACNFRA